MEAVASSLMLTRPPYHEFSFSESFCRGRLARVACAFPVAGFAEIGGRHCGTSFETAIRGWRLQPENQRGRRETVFFCWRRRSHRDGLAERRMPSAAGCGKGRDCARESRLTFGQALFAERFCRKAKSLTKNGSAGTRNAR